MPTKTKSPPESASDDRVNLHLLQASSLRFYLNPVNMQNDGPNHQELPDMPFFTTCLGNLLGERPAKIVLGRWSSDGFWLCFSI